MRCLTHRSVWEVQHRLEEELVGRWAGWRRLWSIYKPRPKQNFFQPPSHLPDPQTKAEDGGGGGGGGEGRGGPSSLSCRGGTGPSACAVTCFTMKQQKHIESRKKRRLSVYLSIVLHPPLSPVVLSERSFPPLSSHFFIRRPSVNLWNILCDPE